MRIAILGLSCIPAKAFANDGFHHHPIGSDNGWIIACAVGLCGGYASSYISGREK